MQWSNGIEKHDARQFLIFCEKLSENKNLKDVNTTCKTCINCKGNQNKMKSRYGNDPDKLPFCEPLTLQITYNITDDVLLVKCSSYGLPSEMMTLKVGDYEWERSESEITVILPLPKIAKDEKIYCSAWNLIRNVSEEVEIADNIRIPKRVTYEKIPVTMTVIFILTPLAVCSVLIYAIAVFKIDIYPDKCQKSKS